MSKPIQLKAVEHNKRATKDLPIFLDDKLYRNLEDLISFLEWDYKSKNRELLILRDKALVALLILQVAEYCKPCSLKCKQFRIYENHILLVNVETVKHGKLRKKIRLPKHGSLAPFTAIFETWDK